MKFKIQPKHRGACRQLLRYGVLPYSACGKSLVIALKPLFDSGVICREKAAGGQRLVVVNSPGFQRWFQQHFPDTSLEENIISSRVLAVAQFRDTKALPSNLPEIICIRSKRDGILLRDGITVETTHSTEKNGVFAFALTDESPFTLRGGCLLIENPAVFHMFENLGLELFLAIYSGGRCSNRFLAWLASNAKTGLKILHLPDYDPLGLTEFLRLYERIGEAISLFTPNNLKALFRSHSKGGLLEDVKNQRMLMDLRKSNHPSIQQVVAMMDESNAGLEQEAILVAKHTPNPP
jgi:Uncharacterized protein conserved in bacteria C-term(DUF2220)